MVAVPITAQEGLRDESSRADGHGELEQMTRPSDTEVVGLVQIPREDWRPS